MKRIVLTIGAALVSSIVMAQVNITIDKAKQYQKIEGFGGLAQESYNWGPTTVMSDNFANDLVNDLGCTIFRHIIDGGFESSNDNSDPNVTDLTKYSLGAPEGGCNSNAHQVINQMVPTLKKLRNLVEKNGEKCQIYGTVFSPPDWMKYINCVSGTDGIWNRMATAEEEILKGGTNGVNGVKDFKDEFAEFSYAYLQIMKNQGVEIDVFSIQNEPVFPQPYSSCVYSPESYTATFKTTGQYLRKKGFNTKMMFTEDIGDLGRYNQFVRPIATDPISSTFADVAAVHSYSANAVSPGSNDAKLWESLDKVSRQRNPNRAFWQTETSGYENNYAGAIDLSVAIFTGLKYGKVNAWMFHGLSHPTAVEGLVINNGFKTDRYYAAKHYFKYIRPGAIMVDAASNTDGVISTAFQHNDKKTLTVVLVNTTNSSKSLTLNTVQTNGVPSTYKMYLTSSSTTRCADQGNVSSNAQIQMPANSIVTLVGENSLPETPTSNEEEQLSNLKFEVYPNPSQEGFYFVSRTGANANSSIEIMDMQGRLVMSLPYHQVGKEQYIESSGLMNGVYTVKYNNQFQKVVINK